MGCDGCELWDPKNGVRISYAGRQTEQSVGPGVTRGRFRGRPLSTVSSSPPDRLLESAETAHCEWPKRDTAGGPRPRGTNEHAGSVSIDRRA